MSFLCKVFGHKMYSITWSNNGPADFTVICTRCEKRWESKGRVSVEINE
jgi:hypothetical protein